MSLSHAQNLTEEGITKSIYNPLEMVDFTHFERIIIFYSAQSG